MGDLVEILSDLGESGRPVMRVHRAEGAFTPLTRSSIGLLCPEWTTWTAFGIPLQGFVDISIGNRVIGVVDEVFYDIYDELGDFGTHAFNVRCCVVEEGSGNVGPEAGERECKQ